MGWKKISGMFNSKKLEKTSSRLLMNRASNLPSLVLLVLKINSDQTLRVSSMLLSKRVMLM